MNVYIHAVKCKKVELTLRNEVVILEKISHHIILLMRSKINV